MEIDPDFGRYVLRELHWELKQSGMTLPELTEAQPEQVEVLAYSKDVMRFRVAAATFEARLTWRPNVAPTVERVIDTVE